MDYVERNLRKDENVIIKAKISPLYIIPRAVWLVLLVIACVVLNVVVLKDKPTDIEGVSAELGITSSDDETADIGDIFQQIENIQSIPGQIESNKKFNKIFNILKPILWSFLGIAGGLPFIIRILTVLTTHLVITNKRVIGKQGILSIKTMDIPIEKIDNVTFSAGVWGNLLKYYDISIKSVGSDGWTFHGICNAQAFKDCANDAIEKHAAQARIDQAEQIASAMNRK